MRVGRESLAANLLAEMVELLLADSPLQEGSGVNPRRAVALEHDQIAAVGLAGGTEEMIEPDFEEIGNRLVGGDVASETAALAVGLDHHRHRVPADDRLDTPLERRVARSLGLLVGRDGVEVGRRGIEG